MNQKLTGLYVLSNRDLIYGPEERQAVERSAEIPVPPIAAAQLAEQSAELLARVEVLLSGWGGPRLDAELLSKMPKLRAFFYGAGSLRGVVTEAVWQRELVVCSAWAANAEPVAEYTLAAILLSLKRAWLFILEGDRRKSAVGKSGENTPGAYGSTVGLVSFGMIARRVCRLLQNFDLRVRVYDPFVAPAEIAAAGAVACSSLDELFAVSDVVSLHTPRLPETEGMIGGRHFAAMKQNATFINTARGAVVREGEMVEALRSRPDLWAVLDVTWPEPVPSDSPLLDLPNLVRTPHIAGSMGAECRRMGRYMAEELHRFATGKSLRWQVDRDKFAHMA